MTKTLHNSDISGTRKNVSDVQVFGNGDMFQLLCKASSNAEGWMKSTKAMEIEGVGCVVQVTTQQTDKDDKSSVAESLTFVPGVRIEGNATEGRKMVSIDTPALKFDELVEKYVLLSEKYAELGEKRR